MDTITKNILNSVASIDNIPEGAHNIRVNGQSASRVCTDNIQIKSKENGTGIDIIIEPETDGECVYIPVVISNSGLDDEVYNDFFIGENSDVVIIAGCGIHNDGGHLTRHNGIHTFYVGKNAKVKYVEKHYGEGNGNGENVLNPVTIVHLEEGSTLEMETVQIQGVDSTKRVTEANVKDNASLIINEKIMTDGTQFAITEFKVNLDGEKSSANVVSRAVAKGDSKQSFLSVMNGNNLCAGHSECDAIIMDNACVKAAPDVTANHVDATLIHEAAIGKIAGEQIIKLMTLGMTEEESEQEIVAGFLR